MPASVHPASDAARCFLLTDMRMVEVQPRSVVVDSVSGRELTATMAQPPQPGSLVQFDLGDLGWVDAEVRWTGGRQIGAELRHDRGTDALLGKAIRQLAIASEQGKS